VGSGERAAWGRRASEGGGERGRGEMGEAEQVERPRNGGGGACRGGGGGAQVVDGRPTTTKNLKFFFKL
jgi:hypothetical protein